MNRDSREFSAALVLGALGGAAVAMALKSGSSRGSRGRPRAWKDLVAGLDWRETAAALRSTVDPVLGSTVRTRAGTDVSPGVGSGLGAGLDALRRASHLLRELGSQVTPGRR